MKNKKLTHGIGINDADYITQPTVDGKLLRCPFYSKWNAMLERCYSSACQKKNPAYVGCSVCDEWITFSNFKAWMIKQDWKGKELDKDVLIQDNKIYSPSTCLFVSKEINRLISVRNKTGCKYPQGVSFDGRNGKYQARVRIDSKSNALGSYATAELAFDAYKVAKYANIKRIALEQTEPLRSALLAHKVK